MFVVDASVWVGYYYTADRYHAPSRRWVQDQVRERRPLLVPTIGLPEVAGAIARQSGKTNAGLRALTLMQGLGVLRVVPVDHDLGLLSGQLAAEQRLRGMDAVYAALARHLDLPLVTWNSDQLQRSGPDVRSWTPTAPPSAS